MGEGEEGTGHTHRATLWENEARQGMEVKGRMGDRCLCLCFGMGRLEQRGLTEGEDTHRRNNKHCGEK